MPKRIAIFTGKRGGFGAMLRLMKMIMDDPEMELRVIASDMHLSSLFGSTIDEVRDRVSVDAVVDLGDYGDQPIDRARALGRCVERLAPVLEDLQPDILLLLGDRGETLAAAMCGAEMGVILAHIQAGDISGGLDDIHRHAITKLAHLHFSQNESQRQRVIRLGEAPERVWTSGAPYVDDIVHGDFPGAAESLAAIGLADINDYFIALNHSDTYRPETAYDQMKTILDVIGGRPEDAIVVFPCSDPGYGDVIKAIEEVRGRPGFHLFESIESRTFIGLMSGAKALVGNSSGGIIEAPYFDLPFVNVGLRQDGRDMAANVITCEATALSISAALEKTACAEFRNAMAADSQPFGDGRASDIIFQVLKETDVSPALFRKRITY
jgi:GDP/UDP-N,N'-diacetylbacillosamine 2-epimerase (hydrolysing)